MKHDARLTQLEENANRATLAELAKRKGTLKWVIYAMDATQDDAGNWRSETLRLLSGLPFELYGDALEAIGATGEMDVRPGDEY